MEIINDEKALKRFWEKVDRSDSGCWNWKGYGTKGYGMFRVSPDCKKLSHRISFELHNQRVIVPRMFIMHSCDNRKCVNPNHLSEGTNQDNMDDKVAKNRQSKLKGIDNPCSKLTELQVLEIRAKYASEDRKTHVQLSEEYGVSKSLISFIVNRKAWGHI
jgi:hypothetical protein